MALQAYEDACTRAELFGQPKPDKDDFLEKNKHLDVVEFEEVEIRAAEDTAMLNDDFKAARGGLHELNTILTSTQTKINRLKGVCGSLTNFFRLKVSARDNVSSTSEPGYADQSTADKESVPTEIGSINMGLGPNDDEMTLKSTQEIGGEIGQNGGVNTALNHLDEMRIAQNASVLVRASKDVKEQMTSHMSTLDSLIANADRAQSSLQHQNKQLRSFLR